MARVDLAEYGRRFISPLSTPVGRLVDMARRQIREYLPPEFHRAEVRCLIEPETHSCTVGWYANTLFSFDPDWQDFQSADVRERYDPETGCYVIARITIAALQ